MLRLGAPERFAFGGPEPFADPPAPLDPDRFGGPPDREAEPPEPERLDPPALRLDEPPGPLARPPGPAPRLDGGPERFGPDPDGLEEPPAALGRDPLGRPLAREEESEGPGMGRSVPEPPRRPATARTRPENAKKTPPKRGLPLRNPAATYSPRGSLPKYHRRWWA